MSTSMPSSTPTSARGSLHSLSAALLAALGLATATPAGAQTVIHACYVPASGTVYRIKAVNTPANCLQPTHVAFSWTDGAEAVVALQNAVKNTDNAAGDVTGVFSNLSVGKLLGRALATTPPTDGQVLSWNAGAQKWEAKTVAAGGSGSGVSDHGALTGLSDDDHVEYVRMGTLRNGAGFGLVSTNGPWWVSPLTQTGAGYGFLAVPERGAIRTGRTLDESDWSGGNIGYGSAAFGLGNIANAENSFATGRSVRAEGPNSAALGRAAQAVGNVAIAAGQSAYASGDYSAAIGHNATATGQSSVGIGYKAKASGIESFSFSGTATGLGSFAFGQRAHTNGYTNAVVFAVGDPSIGLINAAGAGQFVVSAPNIFLGFNATPTVTPGRFLETGPGAYLSSGGVWTNTSDSTKKANFHTVDGESVLSKLAAMPVYTWNYTAEDTTTRHMGPTAQAFRAAFNLGDTDKAISTVDIDGVAIAGVKALEARTKQLKAETQALRAENAQLTERLAQLEALMAQLMNGTSTRSR